MREKEKQFLSSVLLGVMLVCVFLGALTLSTRVGESSEFANIPWPMFQGNSQHTGWSTYNTSNNEGGIKWKFDIGGDFTSSSCVIGPNDTIYIGSSNKILYAVNSDGTEKWRYLTGSVVATIPAIGSDGTIYIGCWDSKLYAINPDGTLKWSFEIYPSRFTYAIVGYDIALGPDDTVYLGTKEGDLFAINSDGTKMWSFLTGNSVYSSPAIDSDGTIYVGSLDNNMYALYPNGTEKWRFVTNGSLESSPTVGSDGTIYIGSGDQKLYAINPDGTLKWFYPTNGSIWTSSAIGSDGTIYIGSGDQKLCAINPDGTLKWFYSVRGVDSPVVSSDGTIYFASYDALYALNNDGSLKWTLNTGGWLSVATGGVLNDPGLTPPAIGADGTIYVASRGHILLAIDGKQDYFQMHGQIILGIVLISLIIGIGFLIMLLRKRGRQKAVLGEESVEEMKTEALSEEQKEKG